MAEEVGEVELGSGDGVGGDQREPLDGSGRGGSGAPSLVGPQQVEMP